MTVSIRASLIFSALGMAALTAAFANPPANKPAETAIASCDECQPALVPPTSPLAPAALEAKQIRPGSLKEGACAQEEQACDDGRETMPPDPPTNSAGPS